MYATHSCSQTARLLAIGALWIGWTLMAQASEIQGFTEPYQDIDVAAPEMGIVEAIEVTEGDRVAKDQILVRMDAAVLEVTLQIASSIMESRGLLESATEELKLQTRMVGKLEELHARKHASFQELERAQAQMRIAEAQLKAVREELEIKALERERARIQIEQLRLRSPIDGIVTRIFKAHGECVLPSDPVILKVVQLDPLLVVYLVPADRASALKRGQVVNMQIADFDGITRGVVEFVSPTADPQSGLTRVRVRLPNPDETLPCGATCYLLLDDQSPSLLLSADR
jgi:RND family efflux transporter MFP subunit